MLGITDEAEIACVCVEEGGLRDTYVIGLLTAHHMHYVSRIKSASNPQSP